MNSSCVSFVIAFNGCVAGVGFVEAVRSIVSAFTGMDFEAWEDVRGELQYS